MSALTFEEPMPGLAPHTDYTLDAVEGAEGVFTLRPAEAPEIRLFVLDAALYAPTYSPKVAGACEQVGLGPGERARILVVATPGGTGTSVNLAAPVVVNETEGRAVQAVLDGWPVRAALAG